MNTIGYLKQAKHRLGIESDYALAAKLGLTRSAVSAMQSGKTTMGDATAVKVATILGLHPALILAVVHAEREKNPEVQAVWEVLAEKISEGFKSLSLRANLGLRNFASAW